MLNRSENDLLCRIEDDALMGQMLRHFWVPAALTEELHEPEGEPLRLRIFGEHLVA